MHRRRGALKKCFVISLHVLHSSPPCSLSMCSLAKTCLCHWQQSFEKFEGGTQHMSGFGSEVQQHLLWCFRLLGKVVTGGKTWQCAMALCEPMKHTCPSFRDYPTEFRLEGKSDAWERTDWLVEKQQSFFLTSASGKYLKTQQAKGFVYLFISFNWRGTLNFSPPCPRAQLSEELASLHISLSLLKFHFVIASTLSFILPY